MLAGDLPAAPLEPPQDGSSRLMAADSRLFLECQRIFDSNQWQYQRVPERDVLEAAFEAHHGRIGLILQCHSELSAVTLVSEGLITLPGAAWRAGLCELMARANLQLTLGNFEFEWETMRPFFRISNVFENGRPQAAVVSGMTHTAITEMDRFIAMVGELAKCPEEKLGTFDVGRLLRREDLLPPVDGNPRAPRPLYE